MLDFLSIDIGTIFFTFCNLLILFLILKFLLFGRVHKILKARNDEISGIYKKADETFDRAGKLENEYADLMKSAREDSEALIRDASVKAQKHSEEIIDEAKREAADIIARAEENIESEKKRAENELKNEVSSLAVMVAGKVIEREIKKEDHEKFINDFIENVGDIQ